MKHVARQRSPGSTRPFLFDVYDDDNVLVATYSGFRTASDRDEAMEHDIRNRKKTETEQHERSTKERMEVRKHIETTELLLGQVFELLDEIEDNMNHQPAVRTVMENHMIGIRSRVSRTKRAVLTEQMRRQQANRVIKNG